MCAAAGHGDCSCFGVGVHGKFTIFLSECQDFLFWGLLWSFFMEEVVGGAFPRSLYESNMQVEP